MSKFTCVKLAYRDKDSLKAALKELGFEEIEEYEEAQTLYGYEGTKRAEKAHIIIRRKHVGRASNDIGFVKTANGYDMIISEYDKYCHGKKFLKQLPQKYGALAVRKHMKKLGYTITSQKSDAKGRIKIRAIVP